MKQQTLLGFSLAMIAACMWGALPIALQQLLQTMNSETAVWYRFIVAALGSFLMLFFSRALPRKTSFNARTLALILLGVFGLSANFFLYNVALHYIPATTSQILSPLSSFVMLAVGVFIFKERFRNYQKIGLILVIMGLILFFNDRLKDFLQLNLYVKGVFIALTASFLWIAYGIAQKILLKTFSSPQILLMMYMGCTLVFTPVAEMTQVFQLTSLQLACLIFCCLNTLIAYGAYAEALNLWDVSKVSAIMTQIPIFTLCFSHILVWIAPEIFPVVNLNWISYIGAFIVVLGALLSAIGHKLFTYKRGE